MPGVLTALDAIGLHADALKPCGVIADDVTEATTLATRLRGADAAQHGKIGIREASTDDRVDAQLRLEEAIDRIQSAGTLAFRKDPAIRGRFERLVTASGPTSEDDAAPPLDLPVSS